MALHALSRLDRSATIAAVLPLWNKRPFLDRCLISVIHAAARHGAVEIVVVDNGSTDDSLQSPVLRQRNLRVLSAPGRNIGAVRNAGAAATSAPVLAFIDSDCEVPDDYFVSIERVLSDPSIDATGFEVRLPNDGSWIERVWDSMHTRYEDGPRHYLNSASFTVRRDIFERLGGFDEALITGEDTDFCFRLTRVGGRIWAARILQVLHLDNPRTLRAFFRKERWRGLGGVTRTILSSRARTAVTLVAFGLTLLAGVITIFLPIPFLQRAVIALAAVSFVPAASVAFRMAQSRRRVPLAPAILLYFVYYLARLLALSGRHRGRGDGTMTGSSQIS